MADTPDTTSQPPTTWAERWPGAIGEPSRADGQILLAEYDPAWPALYEREAARIRSLLGGEAEATTTLHDLGDTVDRDDALELVLLGRVTATVVTTATIATATQVALGPPALLLLLLFGPAGPPPPSRR